MGDRVGGEDLVGARSPGGHRATRLRLSRARRQRHHLFPQRRADVEVQLSDPREGIGVARETAEEERLPVIHQQILVVVDAAVDVQVLVGEDRRIRVPLEVPPQPARVQALDHLRRDVDVGVLLGVEPAVAAGVAGRPLVEMLVPEPVVEVEDLRVAEGESAFVEDHRPDLLADLEEHVLVGAPAVIGVGGTTATEERLGREVVVGHEQHVASPGLIRSDPLEGQDLVHHIGDLLQAVDRQAPDEQVVEIGLAVLKVGWLTQTPLIGRRTRHAIHAPDVPGVARDDLLNVAKAVADADRTEDLLRRHPVGPRCGSRVRLAEEVERILAAVSHQQHELRVPAVVGVADQAADRVRGVPPAVELVVHRLERRHHHVESQRIAQVDERRHGVEERLGHDHQIVARLRVQMSRRDRAVVVRRNDLARVDHHVVAHAGSRVAVEADRPAGPGAEDQRVVEREPHRGERVGHVVDPDPFAPEEVRLDQEVSGLRPAVARQVAVQRLVASPVDGLEVVDRCVDELVVRAVVRLSPGSEHIAVAVAERGTGQSHLADERTRSAPDHRVGDARDHAGSVPDLRPVDVRVRLAALPDEPEIRRL